MSAAPAAFLGTAFHAPERGRIEVLEGALVEVGADGRIACLTPAGAVDHDARVKAASAAGTLTRLSPTQYLIPGLVDLHVHAPQFPQLGKNLHLPLYDWLQKCTFPLEARYADLAFAEAIYRQLVKTLLANGTTTAVYFATVHLPASVALVRICLEAGQRAYVGRVAMDNPDQCPDFYRDRSTDDGLALTRDFIAEVRELAGSSGAVQPVVTPRFIPSCTDRMLEGLGRIAADTGTIVQTHCSESDWEHGYVIDRYGRSDTESLAGFGLMDRHTVLAHANFVSASDMAIIKRRGAGIAHCPLSNIYFSNAVFPLRRALDLGLHVGLGTDISGGHAPSIIDNCRQAIAASRALEEGVDPALAANERRRPGQRIDFREAFWLATAGGAEALGLDAGVFRAGAPFDAVLIDLAALSSNVRTFEGLDSHEDVLEKIVSTATRANIAGVWVEGRKVSGGD
jgi:guanine deaminase